MLLGDLMPVITKKDSKYEVCLKIIFARNLQEAVKFKGKSFVELAYDLLHKNKEMAFLSEKEKQMLKDMVKV